MALSELREMDIDEETLRSYLDTNGNYSAMAALLHVHNNTVRCRMTRLVKDFNLDLDDPQNRLWLWLRLITMDPGPGRQWQKA